MAGNTPFKRWKREVHEGGVADPCIVSWPARHRRRAGGIRRQFAHAVDVLPTVLELVGVERCPTPSSTSPRPRSTGSASPRCSAPAAADAPAHRTTQYFEMFGSRAIYHDGWKAVTFKPIGPLYNDGINWNAPFSEDRWELYHVAVDPAEIHDLADQHPDRLADMVERWWVEARRNQVLPLDNRVLHTLVNPKPDWRPPRLTATYYPGASPVPEPVAANVKNRSHTIEVDVTVPADGHRSRGCCWPRARCSAASRCTSGTAACGTCTTSTARSATWSRPPTGATRSAPPGLPVRPPRQRGRDRRPSRSTGRWWPRGRSPRFTVAAFSATGAGLTCGYELGPAVGDDYEAPFPCTATIHRATVTLSEHVPVNPMVEFERIMSEQ